MAFRMRHLQAVNQPLNLKHSLNMSNTAQPVAAGRRKILPIRVP